MFTTQRLIIRPFEANVDDLNALQQMLAEEAVNTYLPWFPIKTSAETSQFYQEKIAMRQRFAVTGFFLAICLQKDNRPIGYLSLSNSDSHDLSIFLCRRLAAKREISDIQDVSVKL